MIFTDQKITKVLGNFSEFKRVATWLIQNLKFDYDLNVSVFETNIRIVGGLLSAHLLIEDGFVKWDEYQGELLNLTLDIASRLLPAFETQTGIPYGTVTPTNLKNNVQPKIQNNFR